jgi:hypothetical protein
VLPKKKKNERKKRIITKKKGMGGRVAQVVQCPPSKCEALNANLSTPSKKKKKKIWAWWLIPTILALRRLKSD